MKIQYKLRNGKVIKRFEGSAPRYNIGEEITLKDVNGKFKVLNVVLAPNLEIATVTVRKA